VEVEKVGRSRARSRSRSGLGPHRQTHTQHHKKDGISGARLKLEYRGLDSFGADDWRPPYELEELVLCAGDWLTGELVLLPVLVLLSAEVRWSKANPTSRSVCIETSLV